MMNLRRLSGSVIPALTGVAAAMAMLALAAGATRALALPRSVEQQGQATQETTLRATLTGAELVGRAGSPRGFGTLTLTVKPAASEVCYDLRIRYITATNAQIHAAPKGQNGPVTVAFTAPKDTSSTGCLRVERDVISALTSNPSGFYVSVQTADFPQGAIRGQLSRVSALREPKSPALHE